jgi:opacity protein-like surface antigen
MQLKAMAKTTIVAVLAALALPSAVAAAPVAVPPGNSEADQYFETLPAPGGGRSPDSTKTVEDVVREGRLGAGTAKALEGRGKAGRALATIVAQTGPPRNGGGGSGNKGGRSGVAVADVPDKQGLGAMFPLILVGTAVAAGAFAVVRWRRPSIR